VGGERRTEPPLQPRPRPAAPRSDAPARLSPADLALDLQRTVGNRRLARDVARRLARTPSVTDPRRPRPAAATAPPPPRAAPPPHHLPWVKQTTTQNKGIASEIDMFELLTDEQLRNKREEFALKASTPADDKHAQYETTLQAIEFVAASRSLGPLQFQNKTYTGAVSAGRRRNVRTVIEEGIRQTGSLKKSISGMTVTSDVKDDVEFFEREAEQFAKDFQPQALEMAKKMLAASVDHILDVIEDYGLQRKRALSAANDILGGKDSDDVIKGLIEDDTIWAPNQSPKDPSKPSPSRRHRAALGAAVRKLEAQQDVVKQAKKDVEAQIGHGPGRPYYIIDEKAYREAGTKLGTEQQRLTEMWAGAEKHHEVLAAFRGGKADLADVSLGDLGETKEGSQKQMTEMLDNLLGKLADIGRVQTRIKNGDLKPWSLPPVVAMTKAAMFITEGTIRAGKVNDLVEEAQDKSITKYIAEGLIALIAIAAILPSGGTSLGVAIGFAGATLSAASALEDWEHYKKQKMLVNTALDRAQALSIEEPSLVPFAIDLISLGLDGAPLVKAFSKGMEMRNLIRAGEDIKNSGQLKKLVNDLNDIGAKRGKGKLGEEALADVRAAEREAAGGAKAAKAGEVHVPTGSPYKTVDELRDWMAPHVRGKFHVGGESPEWTELWAEVDRAKLLEKYPANSELMGKIDHINSLMRDPETYIEAMAELWTTAARDGISEQEALVRWFGGEAGMPRLLDQSQKKFYDALMADKPAIDEMFRGTAHGAYTHMFQEFALARRLGSREAARDFRRLVAKAVGPDAGKNKFFGRVWDAIFDSYDASQLNSPEGLGPLLEAHLGLQ
jgi:hypothetical protein